MRERKRVPVRHLAYPDGTEKWICLDCGSCKVSKTVEGTEFPTLVRTGCCHYCGYPVEEGNVHLRPTKDHIIPRSKGGPDELWNYVLCHQRCNTKKKDDWPTCPCTKCNTARLIFRRNL